MIRALILILLTLGASAFAQLRPLTPADMRVDTPCFKSGAGRNPRTQQIVEAQIPAQRVGKDGYWMLCEEHAELGRQVGDVTRGTACGAPAVGIHAVTGVIYATANPREFVTPDGTWQRCLDSAFVTKPPAPKDTRCTVPEVLRWSASTEAGAYAASDSLECSVPGGGVMQQGQSRAWTNMGVGSHQGVIVLSCAAGQLNVSIATCAQAQACTASYRGSDDGGTTWWTYQGTLREGAYGLAAGPGGKTRRVQCVGGRIRLD